MSGMRSITALVILVLAVALASPALAAPEARRLWTYVRFLVGHPEATGDTGVLVVPGPAVLTGGQEAERQAFDVLRVIKEMKESLRLADLQPVGFASLWLTVGKEESAPSTPGGPTVHVTLLGYDDTTATYQIRLTQDDTTPTEAKITVKRDGRGLLGGRDGGAAPYFVLMVEPTPPPLAASPNLLRQDTVPPKIITRVRPEYPPDARNARLEGVVILAATIGKDGLVRDLRPVRSEPLGLTEAASKAVSQWRYEPARDAVGSPVESAFYVTVSFTLQAKVGAQGAGGILRTRFRLVPRLPPSPDLPEGTLVAIGCDSAWNAAKPERGLVFVSFRAKGGLATYCTRVREDAVEFFTWTCATPARDAPAQTSCTPVETAGPRKGQWRSEFMEQAKSTAEKLHVILIAEVSPPRPQYYEDYQGGFDRWPPR